MRWVAHLKLLCWQTGPLTLFNQVSIKAEIDPVLLTIAGGGRLHMSITLKWQISLFQIQSTTSLTGRAGVGEKIALERGKWEGGQWYWEATDLISKCSLRETQRSWKHKWNKSRWLTQAFCATFFLLDFLIKLWTWSLKP